MKRLILLIVTLGSIFLQANADSNSGLEGQGSAKDESFYPLKLWP